MKIDGKAIAEQMLTDLAAKHIPATLAVISLSEDPASAAYIRQKQKAADRIGAKIIISDTLSDLDRFNSDPTIHGIIVQRPLPAGVGEYHVAAGKDVDGFEPHSPFDIPVAMAVWKLIESTGQMPKNFVVVGRGETAGAPIARYLEKRDCTTSIIHSKTPNPVSIMKQADCIISCVGKERAVTADAIKPGVILIGVGLWRDNEGKLRGDYNEEEIANIASYYTPTPGGVGPVNVACLMHNLVKAAEQKITAN